MSFGILEFLVAWGISTLIIYLSVTIYPRRKSKKDLTNSVFTALLGAILFEIFSLLGMPLGVILAFLIWLLIIKKFFKLDWVGAVLVAVIILLLNTVIGILGIPRLF